MEGHVGEDDDVLGDTEEGVDIVFTVLVVPPVEIEHETDWRKKMENMFRVEIESLILAKSLSIQEKLSDRLLRLICVKQKQIRKNEPATAEVFKRRFFQMSAFLS